MMLPKDLRAEASDLANRKGSWEAAAREARRRCATARRPRTRDKWRDIADECDRQLGTEADADDCWAAE